MVIKGVTILNPLVSPNTDGIDPGEPTADIHEQEVILQCDSEEDICTTYLSLQ